MSIQVRIKNFGKDTLYSIPVKFAINGATVGSELWTGVLLPDSTAIHTFAPYPSPMQSFTLCSFTTLQGDIHLYNDKVCDTLDVIAPEFDAAIVDIVAPANPTIFYEENLVKLLFQNQGRSPIYNLTFMYTVAGDTISTQNWSSTTPIQPGDTMTFTFDTTFSHDFIGYYFLCAYVYLQDDGYPFNNERCEIYEELWTEITETDIRGYELGVCIPNPASDVTMIPVTIPVSGEVRLNIVNSLGQPVHYQTLNLTPGTHNIRYDASVLARGVYFYYTEYQGRKLIRKMIVD
jgi:hypothetical protein